MEKLNNSVNKYFITGNVYLDTRNSSSFLNEDSSDKFKFTVKNKIITTTLSPAQLSSETNNVVVEEANKLYISDLPTTFRPPFEEYTSRPRSTVGLVRPAKPFVPENNNFNADSRFTSAITSKPIDNQKAIENSVTTEASNSNQRPSTESLTDDIISSVFGQPPIVRQNELTFPGLPSTPTAITTTALPITSNLIQQFFETQSNVNTNLNLVDTSTKKQFFSAKVEQLRNNTKMNATTGFQKKTTGVGQRIWRVEASIPTNNLLVDGKVMRESTTNFQQFDTPALSVNTFVSTQSPTEGKLSFCCF